MEVTKGCEIVQFPSGNTTTVRRVSTPLGDFSLEFIVIAILLAILIFKKEK